MRRFVAFLLDFGSFEGESELDAGRRRIVVGAFWVSLPFIAGSAILNILDDFPVVAVVVGIQALVHLSALVLLRFRPHWIVLIVSAIFVYAVAGEMVMSYLYGGLVSSGGTAIWSIISALVALLILSIRAAAWWFAVFALSIIIAATMPTWVEPTYVLEGVDAQLALNLIGATSLSFLVMVYFVRQRDRFQRQSDDLLDSILPKPIAQRLKVDTSPIADEAPDVSVLFADIVDFTPMTAQMSAHDLLRLLNDVFGTLDDLVQELGLEKIKTVGDEYMVAAGVPLPDQDHAIRIADLALRIQETIRDRQFNGHDLRMRLGINSGPVVAGVIGTTKFMYDLWGATVNTASRMESTGIPSAIQVTSATEKLLRDLFVLEARGPVSVKGLGEMNTFILIGRRNVKLSNQ